MRVLASRNLPALAGCFFGVAFVILLDGIFVAQQEVRKENHFSFSYSIPALFSTFGLGLLLLVSPIDIREDRHRAKIVLFIAWLVLFGSTLCALCITYFQFTGRQTRTRSTPGISLVVYTSIMPLCGSILWFKRGAVDRDEW